MDEFLKVVAAIAWLVTTAGTFIMLLRQRAINREMAQLNTGLGMSVKGFEHELSKALSSFNHRHSIFCEKQSEVFASLYAKLWSVKESLIALSCAIDNSSRLDLTRVFKNIHKDAESHFSINRLYLSGDEEYPVIDLLGAFNSLEEAYANRFLFAHHDANPQSYVDKVTALEDKIAQDFVKCRQLFHATLAAA